MLNITIQTGKENMDIEMIHQYLSGESYWAKGIPLELVEESLSHSYCVGAFLDDRQIGFSRVITDYTTFGWLADVLVMPEFQGRGAAKKMLGHIIKQPWANRLRRMMLITRDAHKLYHEFEFRSLKNPDGVMERAQRH